MYQDRFTGYPVSLHLFEGPLDLLLFLIKENQVHIYDIPIAEITDQYLQYLRLMQSLDIELAGDFLVMASTLLVIKSKMLLPSEQETDEPADGDEEETREGLIRKLLEYKQFKEAAETIRSLGEMRSLMFDRPLNHNGDGNGNGHKHPCLLFVRSVSVLELCTALEEVLKRVAERPVAEIPRQLLTVPMRIKHILRMVRTRADGATFWELCADCTTRDAVIVTFLALLELIRQMRVRVVQRQHFGEIRVLLRHEPAPTA